MTASVGSGTVARHPLRVVQRSIGLWPALATMCVAVAAFAAGLHNGLLSDDVLLLEARLDDAHASGLTNLFRQSYWGDLHDSGLYRPLSLAILTVQRSIFGLDPAPYHAVSLALHALCSLLALTLLARFTAVPVAIASGLLFAAHPIHAEAVATIYGQQDLLAALFFLASLVLYLDAGSGASPLRLATLGAVFFASILCKEQGVLLPVLAFFLRVQQDSVSERRLQLEVRDMALLLALAVYASLRVVALGGEVVPSGAASVAYGYPWWARLNLVVVTVGTYLRLLMLPWGQTTYYGHLRDALFGLPILEAVALLASAALFWPLQRWLGKRVTVFAYAFLGITLLPVANLVPIGTVVAERCLYLPALAISLVVAAVVYRGARQRTVAPAAVAVLVLAGVVLSTRVALQWRTPLLHWETTAADHPRSAGAHARFALFLLQELARTTTPVQDPRFARAEDAIRRALQINPRQPEAWHARAVLALMRSDCDAATEALKRALTLRPGDLEVSRLTGACR